MHIVSHTFHLFFCRLWIDSTMNLLQGRTSHFLRLTSKADLPIFRMKLPSYQLVIFIHLFFCRFDFYDYERDHVNGAET
jgi:hypothetical protein